MDVILEILIMGLGGQGALTTGKILIDIYNRLDYNICFYPFYGSQMRGGSANCIVKISKNRIKNPTPSNINILVLFDNIDFNQYIDNLSHNSIFIVDESADLSNINFKNKHIETINSKKILTDNNLKNGINIIMLKYIITSINNYFKNYYIDGQYVEESIKQIFVDSGKNKYIESNILLYRNC